MHWAVAVPFLVSYVTALILVVFYNRYPGRPYRDLVALIHQVSGIGLIVLPLLAITRNRDDFRMYLQNIRHAWVWTLDDVKWLFLMGPATLNKKIELPHQGKFNAAEKMNFMALTWTYPLYVVTGVLIWLPGVALVAWLLHFSMAMFATPLILGHIFMATINPDTRVGLQGMITGFVDRHWAKHHYRRWYDENFGAEAEPPVPVFQPAARGPKPAVVVEVPLYVAAASAVETVAVLQDPEGTADAEDSDGEEPTLSLVDAGALSAGRAPWPDFSEATTAGAPPSTEVGDGPGSAA